MRTEYDRIAELRRRADQAVDAEVRTGRTLPPLEDLEAQAAPPTVELLSAAAIKPEPIDWLWPGWLARGKLHILAGKPGCGKTTLALGLAAAVTRGGRWPDGSRCETPGDVVIWSGEDDPADTLVPRLMAAGADLTRVHFVGEVRHDDDVRPFDPASDVPLLVRELERVRPALLIVDPLVSAVAADSHKSAEVRRSLQPLVDLAARLGCALVGITHLTKGTTGRDPGERVTGSVAFIALARVVLLATKRENPQPGEASRLLVRAKSNVATDSGGVGYDLEQVEAASGVWASRVTWGEVIEGSARELIAQAEAAPEGEEPDGALGDAVAFLRGLLEDGPMSANEIKRDADGAGFSWATVRRAADRLGVEKRKEGGTFGGRGAVWRWYLPTATSTQDAHDSHKMLTPKKLSTLCNVEHLVGSRGADPAPATDDVEGEQWL